MESFFELDTEMKRITLYRSIAPEICNTEEFVNYLISIKYFMAPASKDINGVYEGGLFDHSVAVANIFRESIDMYHVPWSRDSSWFIGGMFHDLCVLDDLEQVDGVYQLKQAEQKDSRYYGERSLEYLKGHLELTTQEYESILWHRGSYIGLPSWEDYLTVIKKNPVAYTLFSCNNIATYIIGQ